MKKIYFSLLLVVITLLLSGCGTAKKSVMVPNLKKEYSNKNIIVVSPKIKMYEIGTAGQEEIVEWSDIAIENMKQSFKNQIENQETLNYKELSYSSLDQIQLDKLKNTNNLMGRVSSSIQMHANDTSLIKFDAKVKNFDYSIGNSLSNISKEGDLYLFINGYDKVQSSGKVAVETAKAVVGMLFFGVASGDFGGITYSTATLVDGQTGKVLWNNYYFSKGEVDLREKRGTDAVAKALIDELQDNI